MRRMQRFLVTLVVIALVVSVAPPATVSASGPTHVVQPGDTLSGIAVRYGTTVSALMQQNGLSSTRIYVGQRLTVGSDQNYGNSSGSYVVQYGDTLYGIARTFGVGVDALARANGKTINSWVYAGQRLTIPGGTPSYSPPPQNTSSSYYTVRPGDTLTGIAYRHGVSIGALAQINGIRVDSWVYAGQQLKVPGQSYAPQQPPQQPQQSRPSYSEGYYHIVRPGETLARIANQYGATTQQLARANRIPDPAHIYAGQKLLIPNYAPEPAKKPATRPPTNTRPPYVSDQPRQPQQSQRPQEPAAPQPPTVVKEWVGEITQSDCTDEDTLEFRSILRINVEGRKGVPVDVYALPVQPTNFVTWVKTGTKPELGEFGAEVAPLKAGYYAVIPTGLDTQVNIWVDGRCTVYVNFKQVTR